jgi:hypothetical protein
LPKTPPHETEADATSTANVAARRRVSISRMIIWFDG